MLIQVPGSLTGRRGGDDKKMVLSKQGNPCRLQGHDHDWVDCPDNQQNRKKKMAIVAASTAKCIPVPHCGVSEGEPKKQPTLLHQLPTITVPCILKVHTACCCQEHIP